MIDPSHTVDRTLVRAAAAGDRHAEEALVASHLRLVRRIAARYRGIGLPYDDLVQEGSIGLLEAIAHFDESVGVEFDTYARFRIHRSIRNALTDRGRLIRLPKHVIERRRLIDRETSRLVARSGHAPTSAELADDTGLTVGAIRDATEAVAEPVSLDEPVMPDGSPLEALVPDASATDPERTAVTDDETERIDAAVAHLPSRQREVIERTFGFGASAEPIADVAADLHLSRQRTRTIVVDALYKLRRELEMTASVIGGLLAGR